MVAALKHNNFVHNLSTKTLNMNTDTFKVMLSNTAPVATNSLYSDISATELANGNGYTTGGTAVTGIGSTNSAGTESFAANAVTFTSATGNMGPFRYVTLYDSTAGVLMETWDYGSSVTLDGTAAETFTWTPTGSKSGTLV